MKTIKITASRTYTKEATIEIACPENLPKEGILEYLYANNGLWEDKIEDKLSQAILEPDFDLENTRYDLIETRTSIHHLYGGTL